MSPKIQNPTELAKKIEKLRRLGKTVVLCHGVFDLIHPGHISHFNEARSFGDVLVVSVTSDKFASKGPGRPAFDLETRMRVISELSVVDFVTASESPDSVGIINQIQPDIYAKGSEYSKFESDQTGRIRREAEAISRVGGELRFTTGVTSSSSALLNRYFSGLNPEQEAWIASLREQFDEGEVHEALRKIQDLRVLVVGEAIVDKYVTVSSLGKVSKDPLLAFLEGTQQSYAGGAVSVAASLAGLGAQTELLTLGSEDSDWDICSRKAADANFVLHPINSDGRPTIRKTRYVDSHTAVKVFESYKIDSDPLDAKTEANLTSSLAVLMKQADLVVVLDYGHGMMTETVRRTLESRPRESYLAVNVQSNAYSRGFVSIAKYSGVDLSFLNGNELNLELREKSRDPGSQLMRVLEKTGSKSGVVTLGQDGLLLCNKTGDCWQSPGLNNHIVDRVGAGDTVLALVAPLMRMGVNPQLIGFLGNVAGAMAISWPANQKALDRHEVGRFASTLLK